MCSYIYYYYFDVRAIYGEDTYALLFSSVSGMKNAYISCSL